MAKFDIKKISRNQSLYLVKGMDNKSGKKAWYYVEVSPLKEPLFYKKFETEGVRMDLKDYGEIVESGWGDAPPDEIVQKMEENY